MSNESALQIGMGIAFDSSTLKELNEIVEKVKGIQQALNKIDYNKVNKSASALNDNVKQQAKSTQDNTKQYKKILESVQSILQEGDRLIEINKTQRNGVVQIKRVYETLDGKIKTITDTLNEQQEVVKRTTSEKEKQVKVESQRLAVIRELNKLEEMGANYQSKMFRSTSDMTTATKGDYIKIEDFNKSHIYGFQQVQFETGKIEGLSEAWVRATVQIRENANETKKVIGLFNKDLNTFYVENVKGVRGIQDMKRAVTSWSQAISTAIERMLQWAVAGTLIFGTLRLLKQGYQDMIEMESEMANIAKVLPTDQDLAPLQKAATEMSINFGQSIIDTEKAMQSWARQYKDNNDIIKMTNASLLAATATDISFEASVRNLSAIMAEWGYETEKAAHVVDVLNTMSNEYRTTAQDLADALAKTGSGARAVGLDFEYLTGIVTTGIQSLGISGEEMGTMWSRVMARMRGNDQARDAFRSLGIDPNQDMTSVLNALMAKWETLSRAQKENFAITVAGTHHWSKFIGLLDNAETIIEATTDAYFSFGSAQKEVNTIMATTKKQWEQTGATIQKFFQTNQGVLSISKWLAEVFENVFNQLSKMNMGIIALLASVGVIIPQIISLVRAFEAARKIAKETNEILTFGKFVFTKLTNPIFLTIFAVTTLTGVLALLGSRTKKFVSDMEKIDAQFEKMKEEREGFIDQIRGIDDLTKKYEAYSQALKDAQSAGKDTAQLQEKLSLIKDKLAKAIANGNEVREAELKQMPDLRDAAKERITLLLAEINAQRRLGEETINAARRKLQARALEIQIEKAEARDYIKNHSYVVAPAGLNYGIAENSKLNDARRALEQLSKEEDFINAELAKLREKEQQLPEALTLDDILKDVLGGSLEGDGDLPQTSLELSKLTEAQVARLQQMVNKREKEIINALKRSGSTTQLQEAMKEYITIDGKAFKVVGDPDVIAEQESFIFDLKNAFVALANDIVKVVEANESLIDSLEKLNKTSIDKITKELSESLFKLQIEGTPLAEVLGILEKFEKPHRAALSSTEQQISNTEQTMRDITKQQDLLKELQDSLKNVSDLMKYEIPLDENVEKVIIEKLKKVGFDAEKVTKDTLNDISNFIDAELGNLQATYDQLSASKDKLVRLQSEYNSLLEEYPKINDKLTELMMPVGHSYDAVKSAQDAYDKAAEAAKNAGTQFEGTQQESKLLEDIKNAQMQYADSLQNVIDALNLVTTDIPGLTNVIASLQEQLDKTKQTLANIDPEKFYNDWKAKVIGEDYHQYDSIASELGYESGLDMMKKLGIQTKKTSDDVKAMIQSLLLLSGEGEKWVELIKLLQKQLDKLIEDEKKLAKLKQTYESVSSVLSHLSEKLTELEGVAAGIGTAIGFLLENIKIKEGFEFNPDDFEIDFSNLGESIKKAVTTGVEAINWQAIGVTAGITLANIIIDAFIEVFTARSKAQGFNKWERDSYEMHDIIKSFNEFEENQKKLEEAYRKKGIDAIGGASIGAGIGALIGSFIPVIGSGIGALIGGAIGGIIALFATSANKEIEELEKELQNNWRKLTEALGTSVGDIANSLQNAFQATNYFEFLQGWGQNLEDMTKQALIKAFLATPVYQQLYSNLSDVMTAAMLDYVVTAEELQYIRQAGMAIAEQMKLLYPMLNMVDSMFPNSPDSGGSTNYTAGTSVPITYNVHVSVHSQAFMGDEDDAREFALLTWEYIQDEIERG